jgi:hypothetical protein
MSEVIKTVDQAETVKDPASIKRQSCAETLKERRGEVVCFTPALLVTHGKMPLDPVREFASRFEAPEDQQPFCFEVKAPHPPFFQGLGVSVLNNDTIDWDRRLYAITADRAKACLDFLGGIGLHGQDFFASSVAYTLDIPDPTNIFVGGLAVDTIRVHIFGVMANQLITYLAPQLSAPPKVATVNAGDTNLNGGDFKLNQLTQQAGKLFQNFWDKP